MIELRFVSQSASVIHWSPSHSRVLFYRRARWGERIFWFCIILVGVGATLWQLAGVFGLYLAYGTSSQVSISFESPMDFPSVTICNLNPVLKSTLHLDADIQAFMQKQANAANNITQCQLQSIIYKKVSRHRCKYTPTKPSRHPEANAKKVILTV